MLNKDHKWRVCPSLASATAVAVGREQKMLENDVPAVAQNLQHCFAGSLPELSVDEYFLILDEALGLGCLFKKKKNQAYYGFISALASAAGPREILEEGRCGITEYSRPSSTQKVGDQEALRSVEQRHLGFMCLLLENVTQVNEQNQVQLMISLSPWLCFCVGTEFVHYIVQHFPWSPTYTHL